MSEITVETILQQAAQLPPNEQMRLWHLLGRLKEQPDQPQGAPINGSIPEPDYSRALQWLAEHAREYAGQWVALDGDRLIAHGPDARAVYAAAKADGAYLPLVDLVEDPDAPPFAGF